MTSREDIINYLKKNTEKKDYVYSMWLNGADAQSSIDEYSDLDVVFCVEEGKEEEFFIDILMKLDDKFHIDFRLDENYSDAKSTCIHFKNTSEYLLIDLFVQSFQNQLYTNIPDENSSIIYDKNGSNNYVEYKNIIENITYFYDYNKGKMIQESRIKKYIKRNKYLEAYAKYMEYILKPLVTIVRLAYVPQWFYFGLCHINKHLSKELVDEITELYQVKSLKDIEKNMKKARELIKRVEVDINKKYGIDTNKIKYLS